MSEKTWETLKVQYCPQVDDKVSLPAQVVYPAEFLPDQPGRVLAPRCSHGSACNLDNRPSCVWAGTNPGHDPFQG